MSDSTFAAVARGARSGASVARLAAELGRPPGLVRAMLLEAARLDPTLGVAPGGACGGDCAAAAPACSGCPLAPAARA